MFDLSSFFQSIALPDDELEAIKIISHNLSQFLHINLEAGHETLKTCKYRLSDFKTTYNSTSKIYFPRLDLRNVGGENLTDISEDSPLQVYLLEYQRLIETELKQKINEAESIFMKLYSRLNSQAEEEFERMRSVALASLNSI